MSTDIDKIVAGPCTLCGETNYPLSYGGPEVCPACDCGLSLINRLAQYQAVIAERDDLKAKLAGAEKDRNSWKIARETIGRNYAVLEQQLQRAREALEKYGRHIGTGDCWVGLNSHGGTPECSCGYADALRDIEAGK